jgi:hypothetical protein
MTIDELVERARASQPSRALPTALELDLFTAVGDGATAAQVADRVDADVRATAMLLNAAGGNTYTESEYTRWMREAGYDDVKRPTDAPELIVGTIDRARS